MASTSTDRPLSIADIELTTPDRETIVLRNRIEVPTIVILARYYG
ncbi:MAG: hypothetical protein BMS9Abin20_1517 [Acidimicrobiia bacterium]|nr:MAG: hypothetical protein BMS9Abin20_1517 [Acidimicrobiia bacterium]